MENAFKEMMIDVVARRPAGFWGRFLYRSPLRHMYGFWMALMALPLSRSDHILEIACGGGAFMQLALMSGCSASAIDYSPDMVDETIRQNAASVAEERLNVKIGDAGELLFEDESFSKIFCFNAFFYFPDSAKVLREMARVLKPGGRLAIFTASPESSYWTHWLFGPVASALTLHPPSRLQNWGNEVGLKTISIQDAGLGYYLFVAEKS